MPSKNLNDRRRARSRSVRRERERSVRRRERSRSIRRERERSLSRAHRQLYRAKRDLVVHNFIRKQLAPKPEVPVFQGIAVPAPDPTAVHKV
jgi:hypothetical protein